MDLSHVLFDLGRWQEAEKLAKEVLDSRRSLSASLDDDSCKAMQIIAYILRRAGRKQEAENLQWQILEHFEDGKWPEIEGLSSQARSALDSITGMVSNDIEPFSPNNSCHTILISQDINCIGGPKAFQNRVGVLSTVLTKLGYYTQGIEMRARWRDVSDTGSLWLVNHLAEVYVRIEKYDEAKATLKPLIEEAQTIFGPEHKLTLSSMGFLAIAFGLETDGGDSLLHKIIEDSEHHPKLAIAAWHNLGLSHQRRRMKSEALLAFTQANNLAMMHLDEDDTITLRTKKALERLEQDHELGSITSMVISSYDPSINWGHVLSKQASDEGSRDEQTHD